MLKWVVVKWGLEHTQMDAKHKTTHKRQLDHLRTCWNYINVDVSPNTYPIVAAVIIGSNDRDANTFDHIKSSWIACGAVIDNWRRRNRERNRFCNTWARVHLLQRLQCKPDDWLWERRTHNSLCAQHAWWIYINIVYLFVARFIHSYILTRCLFSQANVYNSQCSADVLLWPSPHTHSWRNARRLCSPSRKRSARTHIYCMEEIRSDQTIYIHRRSYVTCSVISNLPFFFLYHEH